VVEGAVYIKCLQLHFLGHSVVCTSGDDRTCSLVKRQRWYSRCGGVWQEKGGDFIYHSWCYPITIQLLRSVL